VIEIVDYQSKWLVIAQQWARRLAAEFTPERVNVTPIGAAAVPTLAGRDEVDLLVTARDSAEADHIVDSLLAQRFQVEPAWMPGLAWLTHTIEEAARVRLLIVPEKSREAVDALAVRDHFASHPPVAKAFSALKRAIVEEIGNEAKNYDAAKAQFFREVVNAARGSCEQPK
jgi:GrpB-like predicted nucleotidyltransferase (UPF0157 family)